MLGSPPSGAAEPLTLLLRWDHQYQFAGYYAAQWNGYYADAGLEVTIQTPFRGEKEIVNSVEEVVSGKVDFGIGSSDFLIARDQGKPVVALATIFHESAVEFFIRRDSGYSSLGDLSRIRVARRIGDLLDVEFQAMLLAEGLDPTRIKPKAPYGSQYALADGSLDLIPAYSFVTPFILKEMGVDFTSIRPRDSGVHFYGDTLFTNEDLIARKQDTVDKFIEASLRGWKYTLENPEEIADRSARDLQRRFPVADPVAFNRNQIEGVKKLTLYPVVAPGYMNPGRWQHMHEWLDKLGLVSKPLDVDGFIYNPLKRKEAFERQLLQFILALAVIGAVLGTAAWIWFLRSAVARRTRELERSQQGLADAQRLALLGNWRWDIKTGRMNWSDEMFRRFGYPSRSFQPAFEDFRRHVHEDDRKQLEDALQKAMDGRPLDIDFRIVTKDGEVRHMNAHGEAKFDSDRAPRRIEGTVLDVSDRKIIEAELAAARDEAEHANRTKSEFLASMSHDLRTPLNAIMGFAGMMDERVFGPLGDPHYEEYVKDILNSGRLLTSLINDILDLSKIEAGKYELFEQSVNIGLLIRSTVSLFKSIKAKSKLDLKVDLPSDLPTVCADERALTQILNNLLSNATKFTPEDGAITVSAKVAEMGSLEIHVADTGIGMSRDDTVKALEPFEQADSTLSREQDGTGLGLFICRRLMRLHDGILDIESEKGIGTTLVLRFPADRILAPV